MKQNEKLAQPFFAKFLESQKVMQNSTENHAEGISSVTIPFLEGDHTMKYPSDGDDELPSK
jgi:hypothetical protein